MFACHLCDGSDAATRILRQNALLPPQGISQQPPQSSRVQGLSSRQAYFRFAAQNTCLSGGASSAGCAGEPFSGLRLVAVLLEDGQPSASAEDVLLGVRATRHADRAVDGDALHESNA